MPRPSLPKLLGSSARRRYESWVRSFSGDLYRFAYRLCGDASTADELVQETYFHAWNGMGGLRDPRRARGWLFRILRHRHAHWRRARARRPPCVALEAAEARIDTAPSPLDALAGRETVQGLLDALEDRYKLPLLMVFVEGLTCRQVADRLELPLGTVLSRLHRARKHLRQVMAPPLSSNGEPQGQSAMTPRLRLGGGP